MSVGTLGAALDGVSPEDEAKCDRWAASGQPLRAAVAWRYFQGNGPLLAKVTTVSFDALVQFVKTGRISADHRKRLELMS